MLPLCQVFCPEGDGADRLNSLEASGSQTFRKTNENRKLAQRSKTKERVKRFRAKQKGVEGRLRHPSLLAEALCARSRTASQQ